MQKAYTSIHPFWIFWIGVLTGALVVGLTFSYLDIQATNLENAILKSGKTTTNSIDLPGSGF